MRRVILLLACAAILVGCGTAAAAGPALRPPAAGYLLRLQDLQLPDFTVQASQPAPAAALPDSSATGAAQLRRQGLLQAASVAYARQADFATANGPLTVLNSVELFSSAGGAQDAFAVTSAGLGSAAGAVPVSTGPLGDEAAATVLVRSLPGGLQAVQVSLAWRVANLVDVLVLRGRYGGTRLDDALALAHLLLQRQA